MSDRWRAFWTWFLGTPLVIIGLYLVLWLSVCFAHFKWVSPLIEGMTFMDMRITGIVIFLMAAFAGFLAQLGE